MAILNYLLYSQMMIWTLGVRIMMNDTQSLLPGSISNR